MMDCPSCQDLQATIDDLNEQLSYYTSRGQRILDLTAKACLKVLESEEMPSPAMLNVCRQLLRDQNIIDLRHGNTPTNHLIEKYPFAAPSEGTETFGVQELAE